MKRIVLIDGDCHICNQSVQFIIKRDPNAQFQFASLQSEIGQYLLANHNISSTMNSMVLIENNQHYIRSTAVLRICKQLKGLWKLSYIAIIFPRILRDAVYQIVANNRYKWFGQKEQCLVPTSDMKKRFLD
ncbi:thiol-disulfide oxidoreductase DCC family protein [Halalkalibacter sp. APA_J-10(15)]|uniref:thiol-disulfide oxidoreductase DCC family protein n=1 Tax=Halalkalibacter sp. APA_J-10(15) TaxID=2933805 RepID=UPI001FF2DD91|nr:DCC1-like thiol-disulfide oxidoreductase family protein [Halalkalibacter sp. APA_J-10(15)]MCK0470935.1 DCC1-like thiol-disulfide oxidoreductase family protein [Halalkalibacter sp. APA_J-10(15)]